MSMMYEDLQSLESEKKSQGFRNRLPPPPAFLQHFWSGPCPLLLTLGLILLLMIGIIVIGSKSARIHSDVETLRASFSNFTSNTEAQVQALHSQGGSLQATITSLKAVIENQEQELQAARSLNDKVFSLEIKLEKEQQQLQAGYSEMLLRVQQLVKDLRTLHCQMAALRSNDSQDACCPIGWLEHGGSCYWFSPFRLSWSEAQSSCQLQNAHLVVVGSQNEQVRTGRACLGGLLVYLKSSPSSPHRSFLSNTCTLWTPGLALLTNLVSGHGWMGQTIRLASRTGVQGNQIIGTTMGKRTVSTSQLMAGGMISCA
ncbi:C-type lectin domain family 10 member A-like [Pipistrellus kuhlii]|uniref:C-type lectin domain family 10 member A-like n=1 Tax=Pipistrellus kuhlii TaxID=59472 RepID=UPI00174ED6B6|nr:C-type lectin domain family 10 member A-like [Pipistrellus kuhlii]XP_036308176.1 C-type lectin domain family 10 member A-like [Pipistrellus kuhlii]XP_036308177.1 C-type lectin domain family 10 member A-like [Pipistrellus kuhlii]XP_045442544.1 C-type lectin domain family 10 member A-like [Pipistrellus kuhlii]